MSIIDNTSKPESILNKKSNEVCCHAVRESVALGETLTALIPGSENLAELMTKVLSGSKCKYLVHNLMHDIFMIIACTLTWSANWYTNPHSAL